MMIPARPVAVMLLVYIWSIRVADEAVILVGLTILGKNPFENNPFHVIPSFNVFLEL